MTSRVTNWFGVIASALFVIWAPEACRAQQVKPTIEQILRVWKGRQEKATSVRFDLRSEKTIHKGSNSFIVNLERRREGSNQLEPNPPRDYIVQGTREVRISGQKLRYTCDFEQWDPNGKKLYRQHYIDVFDGKLYKYLRNPASGLEDHPTGGVTKANASQSHLKFPIIPLIWTFRGSHPQFFSNLEKFELTGQTLTVGRRPCLELMLDSKDNRRREMLYIDQERDYVVVKEVILVEDKPKWQVDATYAHDANVGWVPRSWEYIIRVGKEGRMFESGRMTVSSYVINPQTVDDEFDIAFPPRTRVNDKSSEVDVQYIMLDNGKKGREIPTTANPSYEDLQKPPKQINRWALITIWSFLFMLALSIWIWLQLRRKGQKTQES